MTKTIHTFWDLINTHRIEIPIIQRDYVQGRDTSETEDLRKSFIQALKSALVNEKKQLHLNFVYGKVSGIQNAQQLLRNKEAVKNMLSAVKSYSQSLDLNIRFELQEQQHYTNNTHFTAFIPLDGQQRLTTLYLLHWYLLKRLQLSDELKKLKNFSYKIRPSSKDFCDALIDNDFKINPNSEEKLSEQITDKNWYFLYWSKDPTVRSMLNMLDTIHFAFVNDAENNLQTYWQRLKTNQNPPIHFEFLNLEDYELTDELYIKMNARGKHLTKL